WFAAGEPQLRDALGDEGAAQPVEFLEREQVALGQERHVLGHAVDAAEIAAVRDRDAQVGDAAPERVDQRRLHRREAQIHSCLRGRGSRPAPFELFRIAIEYAMRPAGKRPWVATPSPLEPP